MSNGGYGRIKAGNVDENGSGKDTAATMDGRTAYPGKGNGCPQTTLRETCFGRVS